MFFVAVITGWKFPAMCLTSSRLGEEEGFALGRWLRKTVWP